MVPLKLNSNPPAALLVTPVSVEPKVSPADLSKTSLSISSMLNVFKCKSAFNDVVVKLSNSFVAPVLVKLGEAFNNETT